MTGPTTAPQTWPPDDYTGPALWRIGDGDHPVTVTGFLGEQNGERYFAIEGSTTGIPAAQLHRVLVYGMAETAQWHARGGWKVFPLVPRTKLPLTPHGYKDAATDPATIAAWWQQWPDANIGLACGPSGLIALDGDPIHFTDESRAFLDALLADHPTANQTTPTGGTHLLYRLPDGVDLNNSSRGLPPGFDVRVNGFVLLAPSLVEYHGDDAEKKNVPDGFTGRYAWLPVCGPHQRLPQPLPDFVLDLLRPPQRQTPIYTNGQAVAGGLQQHGPARPGYGAAALEKELDILARTPEGGRNEQLNRSAYNLGQLVAGGELMEAEVIEKLTDAAAAISLDETETRKTISSGLAAGMKQPRSAPPKNAPGLSDADLAALMSTPPVSTNGSAPEPDNPADSRSVPPPPRDAQHAPQRSWTVAELLAAQFPEPKWSVPGLLPVGLTILAGRPKLGKSWLALQMAVAVGSGGYMLGQKVDRGKVLYLALEDNPRRIQDRLRKQYADLSAALEFRFEWDSLAGKGTANLIAEVDSHGYGLVIVDTISRALGRADQMDLGEMSVTLGSLQRLAINRDISILLIDHHRKTGLAGAGDVIDDIMGSTGKGSVADAALGLYRKRGEKTATLKASGREVDDQELTLQWDAQLFCWQSLGNARDYIQGEQMRVILDAVRQLGQATHREIMEATRQDKGNSFKRIQELVSRGQLRSIAGPPIRYAVA